MSNLNKKVFEFLSSEENWDTAVSIYHHVNDMKPSLLSNFWNGVKNNLEEKLDKNVWDVGMSDDIHERYSTLRIAKKSWNDMFTVAYERLGSNTLLGAFRDWDSKKVPDELHEKMKGKAIEVEVAEDIKNTKWYFAFFYVGDDYKESSTYKKLLPLKIENHSDKYCDLLINFADNVENIIDDAIIDLRKR